MRVMWNNHVLPLSFGEGIETGLEAIPVCQVSSPAKSNKMHLNTGCSHVLLLAVIKEAARSTHYQHLVSLGLVALFLLLHCPGWGSEP